MRDKLIFLPMQRIKRSTMEMHINKNQIIRKKQGIVGKLEGK